MIEHVRAEMQTSNPIDVLQENPVFVALILLFRLGPALGEAPQLDDILRHLDDPSRERPGASDLHDAPFVDPWCAVFDRGCPVLIGHVEKHPTIRLGARFRSSPVFQISHLDGWARTWSRFYRLGQYDDHLPEEWIRRGVIHEHVTLIQLEA
ncbi:DUF6634 family protein [Stagnihabitans tardus]|uniref:Uncharacterized protein n=1 Tax=Stagnihabitans tardus TaxID=2699202 RepID=A0AAE4YFM0_9RHOB|nr:DUF6634 family protein [Stagnihabitans tardus]NBZ89324.1 hypothetical protein [Stagnihabitans tardus]